MIEKPIPLDLKEVAGWKEVPIKECHEQLVPLGSFSSNWEIFTDSIYAGERLDSPYFDSPPEGNLLTAFVRKNVAEQLKRAQKILPDKMYFVIFDAYRTLKVQETFYNNFFNQLKDNYPEKNDSELSSWAQQYVSLPSHDPNRPSPHNTGGAVDLAILKLPESADSKLQKIDNKLRSSDLQWQEVYALEMKRVTLIKDSANLLNFGTPYDWADKESSMIYFELIPERNRTQFDQEVLANRRLLYNVMTSVGFASLESEWWHFNSIKSQMGARVIGLPYAEYGTAILSEENLTHEQMRRDHRIGSLKILDRGTRTNKLRINQRLNIDSEFFDVAQRIVMETGDLRTVSFQPKAARISPNNL